MGTLLRTLLVVALAASVPAAVWVFDATRSRAVVAAPQTIAPVPHNPFVAPPQSTPAVIPPPVAAFGCAAAACHGAPSSGLPSPIFWQSSATHFTANDPHTRAYVALQSPRAAQIMARLKDPMPATEAPRCLACHTDPASASPQFAQRTDGIRCETCHGRANTWLAEHTAFGSKSRTAEYDRTGMTKLFDLGVRAETCVGCHVGAPAKGDIPVRDMNHDMIAAGHPRLNFDMAEYQRRMRPHWDEKPRTASDPKARAGHAREVQTWLVGRVAHAEAATRLLEDRARRADPWPEFAEFNCFACHHEFEPESWRRTGPKTARRPGSAAWQTVWPATRPADFARFGSEASRDLGELIAFVERSRVPNPAHTAKTASTTAAELRKIRDTLSRLPEKEAARLAVRLFAEVPPGRADSIDWDEAGQMYHGLAAIDRARMRAESAPATPGLWMLGDHLRFPRSPGGIGFDSPRGYTPLSGRSLLRECLKSVPARADIILR